MQIIDVHTHIFPQKIEEVAVHVIGAFYDMPEGMEHHGSSQELLAAMARGGISRSVVFSTATTTHQVERINRFILQECQAHPEFIGLGTIHEDYQDFVRELAFLRENGIHGIKLHPDFQKFNVDAEPMLPIYEEMAARDMFLIAHIGDPRYDFSHPRRLARVAGLFPNLRCIAAHFGGWGVWPLGEELLADLPNVYIDTSSSLGFVKDNPERVTRSLRVFDRKKIFFGSDFPMWDPGEELQRVLALNLQEDFLEDILWNNFRDFYHYQPL